MGGTAGPHPPLVFSSLLLSVPLMTQAQAGQSFAPTPGLALKATLTLRFEK